jgi:oligopeptide transport system permease protein
MVFLIAKRFLLAPLILLVMISATFFLVRLAPGGPFSAERALPPEVEKAMMARYHMDDPLLTQYAYYLGSLLKGDLGPSLKHRERTVNQIVAEHLPVSFVLGAWALVISLCLGLGAGLLSALVPRTIFDYAAMGLAVLGISLPAFVVGPLLQMGFARGLKWFPVAGTGSWEHLVLPAFALGLPFAARFARLTRAGMLDVLSEDFIRTARAKGLTECTVILRHSLRGGMLPVVSFLGPAIASITTGSLVVERIFSIPGLGREFVESALNRDYTLVMGTVIVYGTMIIFCNLLTDLAYAVLDPRVRGAGEAS